MNCSKSESTYHWLRKEKDATFNCFLKHYISLIRVLHLSHVPKSWEAMKNYIWKIFRRVPYNQLFENWEPTIWSSRVGKLVLHIRDYLFPRRMYHVSQFIHEKFEYAQRDRMIPKYILRNLTYFYLAPYFLQDQSWSLFISLCFYCGWRYISIWKRFMP